ncbi:MAG: S8 family serine peptidase [Paludibacteraceae bacterium]
MKNLYCKILTVILFTALNSTLLNATGYYFYVQLKDKRNSTYSIEITEAYLSKRAIERRIYYNVPIDSTDLPVNTQYINEIEKLGIHVHCTTKWLNGLTVLLSDTSKISQVRGLTFVKMVQYTGLTNENQVNYTPKQISSELPYNYGAALTQISHLNGTHLHENNFRGENIHIAILDAGFKGVNTNPAFNLLRNEGRLLVTKDFVNPYSNIYAEDIHGAYVLSTMAAEMDGTYVGTAPKASYLLVRTEATIGEYLCEPDFWISGIEYADSAGVDLATTSLGYTTFDDPKMNYTYNDLNGRTARASIAAAMACKKGIILLNAAGNDGNNFWKYISVPADAEGVIAVGSVSKDSVASPFSSIGPASDGRIKPELCAIGTASALVAASGSAVYGSGTSFATPILAGLTACYLQAARTKMPPHTLDELRENLYHSAHLYSSPTPKSGYGIPDFAKALDDLKLTKQVYYSGQKAIKIFIKENVQILRIQLDDTEPQTGIARLYAINGQLIKKQQFNSSIVKIDIESQTSGIYILKISKE